MNFYKMIKPNQHSSLVNDLLKVICFKHKYHLPGIQGCQGTEDIWIGNDEANLGWILSWETNNAW